MSECLSCGIELKKLGAMYCSNRCQANFVYTKYIDEWKHGKVNGTRGVNTKNLSGYLIRYLRNKHACCSLCGWKEVHSVTGKVPLEIDHIDGDAENNQEENLRLIYPNCHALSSNFRNLNRGRGRDWRRMKYIRTT